MREGKRVSCLGDSIGDWRERERASTLPWERDVGFMIHMALGLRRNSSTNSV